MSLAILFHFLCTVNSNENTPTNYNKATKHITPSTRQ